MRISSIARWLLQKPGTIELAPFWKLLPQVGGHEQRLRGLTDGELAGAAQAAGDDAEICACGREAARRALGERPYDVQVLGALAMLSGLVAEMATGEGKTLGGALAAAGYALRGRSVHVMSVNDYLARRDAEWMRPVYDLLGVTVGWIGQGSTVAERRRAYAAQVTYASVSEFGFDVLRDRLVTDVADLVAGDPDVVLIDEADSVLVDEARVPLVLAGAAESADADREMARIAAGLHPGDHYEVDEDARNVSLTSAGARAAEQALGGLDLYTTEHAGALTRLNVALHAHALLQRDVDYIVRDGAVHLINESRGRVARRQRWPDGLHAAVEAKEGLAASESGEILDSITIQSLVRHYRAVCGMTGTAVAAGEQFREFYGLEIAVIPPNRPCIRTDEPDRLYPAIKEKEKAVVGQVAAAHATGRPILIGTLDVAESERLAGELGRAGLRCTVLNAKNDVQEAAIVAEAGAYGAITVSTQMAGRGTDIRLGGSDGDRNLIAGLGGLYVIGTGRHASSRLDQQLRGRAGRQGDPGGSVFFASMEDELILQYAPGDARAGSPDSKAHWTLGHAQRVAEGVNLEIHRNTWQYNKLVEDQRRIVLHHRDRVLRADDALAALARQCPKRLAELSQGIDRTVLTNAARQIVLFHLDQAWAEHLAFLADLREGIHLRALARGTVPLNEFNREAVRAFTALLERAAARSADTFRTASITADGIDLEAIGLKRPSSTWTYLVHENPFGTDIDRALRSIARRIRKIVVLCRTEWRAERRRGRPPKVHKYVRTHLAQARRSHTSSALGHRVRPRHVREQATGYLCRASCPRNAPFCRGPRYRICLAGRHTLWKQAAADRASGGCADHAAGRNCPAVAPHAAASMRRFAVVAAAGRRSAVLPWVLAGATAGLRVPFLARPSAEKTIISHSTRPAVEAMGMMMSARLAPVMTVAPSCGEAWSAAAVGTAADMVPVHCIDLRGDVSIVT